MRGRRGAVAAGLVLIAAACSESQPSTGTVAGVSLAATAHPPDIQCLLDAGATIIEENPNPATGGTRDEYRLELPDLPQTEVAALVTRCNQLRPPPVELSDDEVRGVYERWLDSAECLRDHGYSPIPAPPYEVFLADWRGDGPWMPTDGIDTNAWSDATYVQLKADCQLDFYDRG